MNGRLATLPLLLLLAPVGVAQQPPAAGLRVATGTAPETVTVGDRFRAYVRVSAAPGARVRFEPLPVGDSLQQTDSLVLLAPQPGSAAAAYPLAAWVAGTPLAAHVRVTVTMPEGGSTSYRVPLRLPVVRSVLPPDTAGLRPRPAKGYLTAPDRRGWGWAWSGLIVLLAALAAAVWLIRRRGRRGPPQPLPREAALRRLDALLASGPPPPGEVSAYIAAATRAVRDLFAALRPRWGVDLTSDELLDALAGSVSSEQHDALAPILEQADRIKFAGEPASPAEAVELVRRLRDWTAGFHPSEAPEPVEAGR